MVRYRLRFLLQEFDLPRGSTLIGRSSDCHVTIEDPLVSRQHARIENDGEKAFLYDLGSRNGVKLNGQGIKEPTLLKDGDRLRVGTQELVFCKIEQQNLPSTAKTTGFLRHCGKCHLPYPQEVSICPHCGTSGDASSAEEDTLSGQFGGSSQGAWSVQLLIEVLEKALSLSRVADAERILRRATAQIEERIVSKAEIDPKQLVVLAQAAAKISLASSDPTWGAWIAQVYRRVGHSVPPAVSDLLSSLVTQYPDDMNEPIDQLVQSYRARASGTPEEAAALARLEQLHIASTGPSSSRETAPNPLS